MLDKSGNILLKPSPLKKKPGRMGITTGTAPMGAGGEEAMDAGVNEGMEGAVAAEAGVPMHGPESHAGMQRGGIGGMLGGGRKRGFMGGAANKMQEAIQRRMNPMGKDALMEKLKSGGIFGAMRGGFPFKEQSAFKMRSGNTTPFKLMGSSPAKQIHPDNVTEAQKRQARHGWEPAYEGGDKSKKASNKNIFQKAHEKLQSIKDPFAKQKRKARMKKRLSDTDLTKWGDVFGPGVKPGPNPEKDAAFQKMMNTKEWMPGPKKRPPTKKKSALKQAIGGGAGEALAHHRKYLAKKEFDKWFKKNILDVPGGKVKSVISEQPRGRVYTKKLPSQPKAKTLTKQVFKQGAKKTIGKTILKGATKVASKLALPLTIADAMYSFGKTSVERKKAGKSGFNISKSKTNKGFNF